MPLVAHRPFESFDRIRQEGQEVLDVHRAHSQDIRELHIGLLNMMPDGALQATERQFLRLIGSSNRIAQFYVHIFTIDGVPRSPEMQEYIDKTYEKFEAVAEEGLDGLIVTGTNPIHADLSDEPYVNEMKKVFEWADNNVTSVLCSCLASHAAFKYFYGIERQALPEKLFGVFSHKVLDKKHPLLSNVNTRFDMPHSRKNDVSAETLIAHGLEVLVAGEESGVALATSPDGFRHIYLQGHPEYDVQSLLREYRRDALLYHEGLLDKMPSLPAHYFNEQSMALLNAYFDGKIAEFPDQAISEEIEITWRDTAKGIFANWLGLIYQLTHHDRKKVFMDGVDPTDPLGRLHS
ncbi:homoserine O-succinyltransferase MetA [Suttonella ornithocola]|uniref:Homoserine O-succinyltransferase n=1 Tax=Suttonella ornithocola TaxID=279832 RepID=A0A380MY34_9GAMM|nr:homoserine O-succinyltransferase [Suttonella ornithocola]SUO96946.1 Homoserine O-succinyltransferase [Suttonella ornithocola]